MGIQADVKDALDSGRDDLVRVLAEYRVVPAVVDRGGGSDLLGDSSPTFTLDSQGDEGNTIDRQTTVKIVNRLGLESEGDCDEVREEIESHSAWG